MTGMPLTTETSRRISRLAYVHMTRDLTRHYKISVRKWRSSMVGAAWEITYHDGRIKRAIAAPRPRSPVSAAIFLHEVAHHAIGFKRYESRCLEEHYAWQWTFREMRSRGIPVTASVVRHYHSSMAHYVQRARQGGEAIPGDLLSFA